MCTLKIQIRHPVQIQISTWGLKKVISQTHTQSLRLKVFWKIKLRLNILKYLLAFSLIKLYCVVENIFNFKKNIYLVFTFMHIENSDAWSCPNPDPETRSGPRPDLDMRSQDMLCPKTSSFRLKVLKNEILFQIFFKRYLWTFL
jgi:hypothetical protein